MSEQKSENNLTQIERERLIILYIAAVERGEFETVGKILEAAAADAELERMIFASEAEMLDDETRKIAERIINSSNSSINKHCDQK